jgi:hypothetical protein
MEDIMKLVQETMDFGNVAEAFVSGIASITEIAPGILRVGFYSTRERENESGTDNVIVDYQIWSAQQWATAMTAATKAWKEMRVMRGQPKIVHAAGLH